MTGWTHTPAGRIARQALNDLLRETDPGAFGPHFEHPGSWSERSEPHPLAAVRAARQLARTLERLVLDDARRARGDGEGWEEVAGALDVQAEGWPDAMAAYMTVLGVRAEDTWWSAARGVVWTCSSCGEAVRDYGPECGGPDDREAGHSATCPRHAAEVRAWQALWA